jgi:hypothetical protein
VQWRPRLRVQNTFAWPRSWAILWRYLRKLCGIDLGFLRKDKASLKIALRQWRSVLCVDTARAGGSPLKCCTSVCVSLAPVGLRLCTQINRAQLDCWNSTRLSARDNTARGKWNQNHIPSLPRVLPSMEIPIVTDPPRCNWVFLVCFVHLRLFC